MLQFSPLRTAAILFVAVTAIFFALPNLISPEARTALSEIVPLRSLVLGLDLRGGSHLLMQVNRQEVVDERLADLRRDARSILANERGIGNIITTVENGIEIELTEPARIDEAREALAPLTVGLPTSILGMGQVQDVVIGQTPSGRLTAPTALRAARPASPKTSSITLLKPLTTCGMFVNSGVQFTSPNTFTTCSTRSSVPRCLRIEASIRCATSVATSAASCSG